MSPGEDIPRAFVLVTALTFFPALSLGPIAEDYLMHLGPHP